MGFTSGGVSSVRFSGGCDITFENQKKINDFQDKLNRASFLYTVRTGHETLPPSISAEGFAGDKDEILKDIQQAERDLATMNTEFVAIENARDDPSGYKAYLEHQGLFDEAAESFEKHADEAMEGVRDPQTFTGDVKELGRDAKELWDGFWRSSGNA